jgi:hypothetical protein
MYAITSKNDNIFYSLNNIIMYFEINKDIQSTLLNIINDYRDKLTLDLYYNRLDKHESFILPNEIKKHNLFLLFINSI